MELYWPKLRRGGIMAGHDFVTAETVRGCCVDDRPWLARSRSRCDSVTRLPCFAAAISGEGVRQVGRRCCPKQTRATP